jgi:nitrogen fixation protein FixH
MGNEVNKSQNRSVRKTAEGRGDIREREGTSSPDVNSTKIRYVVKADTTRKSRYTTREDSMRHPLERSQNWAIRSSRRIDKKFEETAAVGKAWFVNNSKGSEAGLSMGEARLRPLSSTGTEGEQEGEQREQWRCSLSREGEPKLSRVTNS